MAAETEIKISLKDLMSASLSKARRAMKLFRSSLNGIGRSLTSTQAKIAGLAGAFGAFKIGDSFIQANKSIESTFFQLKAVTGSAAEAQESVQFLKDFALENPVQQLETFSRTFTKLRASGIDPTTGALQTLTDAASAFALTGDQLDGVTLALSQIASNGRFVKEEFNQLAERLPGVAKLLANKFNVTVSEMFEKMRKGAISSEEGLTALFGALNDKFKGAAEGMKHTWTATINSLALEWSNLMIAIGETGWWDDVKNGIRSVSTFIRQSHDDLVAFSGAMRGLAAQIARDLLGQFNSNDIPSFLQAITRGATRFYGIIRNSMTSLKAGLQVSLGLFGDLIQAGQKFGFFAPQALDKLDERLAKLKKDRVGLQASQFASGGLMLSQSEEALRNNQDAIDRLTKQRHALANSLVKENIFQKQRISLDEAAEMILKSRLETEQLINQMDAKAREIGRGEKKQIDVGPSLKERIKREGPLFIEEANKKASEGSLEAAKTFRDNFIKRLTELREKTQETFGTMTRLGTKFAEDVSRSMANSFESFFFDVIEGRVQSLKEILNNFFKSIAKSIASMLSQQLATGLLSSVFTGSVNPGATAGQGGTLAQGGGLSKPNTTFNKPTGSLRQKVEIVNNTQSEIKATETYQRNDAGEMVLGIVIEAVNNNRNGFADLLRGATR